MSGSVDGNARERAERMLELAVRSADQLIDDARVEAERLRREARVDADAVLSAARNEALRIRAKFEETRRRVDADIVRLRREVEQHRELLRDQLHAVVAQIETAAVDWSAPDLGAETPIEQRLRQGASLNIP